ncbi:TPA: glycosyltransferase family 2 protein, partial [Vibrio cholerae]
VSVILCVYNGESYIKDSIVSLLNQTYNNIEIVVCDDGSKDSTADVVKKLALNDSRIKYFYKENSGLTRSLNYALDKCSGAWIARQDADDISEPDRIQKQLQFCIENALDFSTSLAERFNESGSIDTVPNIHPKLAFHLDILKYGNLHVHGTFFIKKNILQVYRYNENCRFAQDYDLLIRFIRGGVKCGLQKERLYRLRLHDNSISSQKKKEQCASVLSSLQNNKLPTGFYIEQYNGLKKFQKRFEKKLEILMLKASMHFMLYTK